MCILLLYLLVMSSRAHAIDIIKVDQPQMCKPIGLVGVTEPVPCAMLAAILNKRYSECKPCKPNPERLQAGI